MIAAAVVAALVVGGAITALALKGGDDEKASTTATTTPGAPGEGALPAPTSTEPPTTTTTEPTQVPTSVDVALSTDAVLGDPVQFSISPDVDEGIDRATLFVDDELIGTYNWPVPDLEWTPQWSGDHTARVELGLDDGGQLTSQELAFSVDLDDAVLEPISRLSAALGNHDWDTVRQIEPDKRTATDGGLERGYAGLVHDTFVPVVANRQAGTSTVRVYGGLVAEMVDKTRFFCATWDIDPIAGTVNELGKDGGIRWTVLVQELPQGTTASGVMPQIERQCRPGAALPG